MAPTTTATTPLELLHAKQRSIGARLADVEAKWKHADTVLNVKIDAPVVDVIERMRLQRDFPELSAQLRTLRLEAAEIEREVAALREIERERLRAEFDGKKRAALKAHISDVLRARTSALVLQKIQLEAHERTGEFLDPLFLQSLLGEAHHHWIQTLRAYGFADVVDALLKE